MCTAYKERKKIDFNRYPELEAFIMCALIAGIIMIPAMILNHGYFALSNDFSGQSSREKLGAGELIWEEIY